MRPIDFIGIGAPRSGTTWVSTCMREHPDICFANPKELSFFNQRNHFTKGLRKYKMHFKHCLINQVKGEWTTAYFLHEEIGVMLYELNPKIKILACLRNPIDRAISHAHMLKNRLGLNESIEEILFDEKHKIVKSSLYYRNLSTFLRLFPKNQYLVLQIEDSYNNPKRFIQKIYQFLGVENCKFTPPSLHCKINTISQNKYHLHFFERWYYFRYSISSKFMRNIFVPIFESSLYRIIRKINTFEVIKSPAQINTGAMNRLKLLLKEDTEYLEKVFPEIDITKWE